MNTENTTLDSKWRWVWLGLLIFSFLGFLDAAFLTFEHYRGEEFGCPLFGGCDLVLLSKYSVLGSIPLALIGAIYYLALFVLAIIYMDTKKPKLISWFSGIVLLGLLGSLYFLYLQLFVIKALCFYCVVSLGTTTILFILAAILFFHQRKSIYAAPVRETKNQL